MRFSGLRLLRIAPLLALLVVKTAAADVPISEVARKHFNAGVAYLQDPDGARYAEAYPEFLAAYQASPSWKILGNLGLAAMKLERDGEAVDAYTKYLAEGGNDLDPSEKEQISRDLNTLKTSLVNFTMDAAPTGAILIDERIPPTGSPIVNRYGPLSGPNKIGVKAGKHRFTAQLQGYDNLVWEVDAQPGVDQAHTFELKKTPPPSAGGGVMINGTSADRPTSPLRYASYAAFGVGVVGVAGGTIFALQAKSKHDAVLKACGQHPAMCALDADSDAGRNVTSDNNAAGRDKVIAIVGYGVGGLGIAAGITLFILSNNNKSQASSSSATHVAADKPRVLPYFGVNSAGVVGQF